MPSVSKARRGVPSCALTIAAICSSVVLRQPPIIVAPASRPRPKKFEPVAPSATHQPVAAMRFVMGFDMNWRPCQCHFGQGAYDKAITAVMDCDCATTYRRRLGRQTAIHEHVLNTQSKDELMDLYEDWGARYDRDVNDTWGYSGPERTTFWLRHYLAPEGARMLDAGCGTGMVAVALSEGGFRLIDGIDYSTAVLAEAAKKKYLPAVAADEYE